MTPHPCLDSSKLASAPATAESPPSFSLGEDKSKEATEAAEAAFTLAKTKPGLLGTARPNSPQQGLSEPEAKQKLDQLLTGLYTGDPSLASAAMLQRQLTTPLSAADLRNSLQHQHAVFQNVVAKVSQGLPVSPLQAAAAVSASQLAPLGLAATAQTHAIQQAASGPSSGGVDQAKPKLPVKRDIRAIQRIARLKQSRRSGEILAEECLDGEAAKRRRRMVKNRESAARSRHRKQAHIESLEKKAAELEEENAELKRRIEALEAHCDCTKAD